jgi:hypothetical protein
MLSLADNDEDFGDLPTRRTGQLFNGLRSLAVAPSGKSVIIQSVQPINGDRGCGPSLKLRDPRLSLDVRLPINSERIWFSNARTVRSWISGPRTS